MERYQNLNPRVKSLCYQFEDSAFGYMNLKGVHNARDLGGMPTTDGHIIAPTKLFRTGKLVDATAQDTQLLRDLNLGMIVDFRMEPERAKAPDPIQQLPETSIAFIPVVNPSGGGGGVSPGNSLRQVLLEANGSKDSAVRFVHDLYRELFMSEAGRKGYSEFFTCVIDFFERNPQGSLLWHCSAGKDRTGAAAVLLEYALGVPKEMIMADYMASNLFTTNLVAEAMEGLTDLVGTEDMKELVHMYYGVAEDNLTLALNAVERKFGSLDDYLTNELNVDEQAKDKLKSLLLVKP